MAGPIETFWQRTREARKIIVVDFGFLGDSVHLVPALWEIKRNYPHARLHTLSSVVGAEVLKLAPRVDRAWAFPLTAKSPAWWRHWDIVGALRREKFDVAFNFSGSDRTIFVTAALGAKHVLAHEGGRKHFWNRWVGAEWVERRSRDLPVFEQRRQILAAAGCSLEPARFDLSIPNDAQAWAAEKIIDRPIHLALSASNAAKEWPLENWIDLVKLIGQRVPGVRMVASAGANAREQDRLQRVLQATNTANLQKLENLSIPQLAAMLQHCRAQIGADSGTLHLAMALGIPTVTVFRRYAGLAEWTPIGTQHRQVLVDCRCINENREDCLKAGRSDCLGSITAEQVCGQLCQLVEEAK